MELEDVFTGAIVTSMSRNSVIDVHKAGCRDLGNRGRYPDRNESAHKTGATGSDLVIDWFDNGILEEAVADEMHTNGGDRQFARRYIMETYADEFDVKACASKLIAA